MSGGGRYSDEKKDVFRDLVVTWVDCICDFGTAAIGGGPVPQRGPGWLHGQLQ